MIKSRNQSRMVTNRRRYYLHQKIKTYVKYDASLKTVFIPFNKELEEFGNRTAQRILELRDVHHYNLQSEIV